VLIEKAGIYEAENTARAAINALATGQAVAVIDWLALPGVAANINAKRTMERANPTLDAAR